MTSGVPWHMRGVRSEVLDSAREAARRSGMSVEEWLDTVIAQSARNAGVEPAHQPSNFDDRSRPGEPPDARGRQHHDEPLRRGASFSDVSARLDELARQVDHLSHAGAGRAPLQQPATGGGEPATATVAPIGLPRAPNQSLPDLEQQLRQINTRLETVRPCGIDAAVETLRDDLAEIGVMLKEAMPRQAIEALESEIRSLAARIDSERHAGADGLTMAGVERGLAEVRDALRALTPAEGLVGFDQALHGLSQKIDRIASAGPDPEAFKQLEGAIVALRGVVSHVASNDALAQLSEDVRALSVRLDQVATSSNAFSLMEQRIAAIADALQSRGAPAGDTAGLETAVRGLADKVDQLHASQRVPAPQGGIDNTEADALKRDIRRTQDSLETVHGTLGHVVDRLTTIESGIRGGPQPGAAHNPELRPSALEPSLPLSLPDVLQSPPTSPSQPAMFSEAPAVDEPSAPRTNPSPSLDRRPIDPDLPPDHPLEPGAGRSRTTSPADRIAASEAALEHVRPPVIPDPAGKSNFIAAARRAAQAALAETPPSKDKRATDPAANNSSIGKLGRQIRKVVVGVGLLAFVLGAVHFVSTQYWPGATATTEQPETEPPATEPSAATQATGDESVTVAEPPPISSPPPSERQSTALPGISGAPNTLGIETGAAPATPATPPGPGRETTGSVQMPAVHAAITPPTAIRPTPPASPSRNTPADRLPPGIGGGLRAAAAQGDAAAAFEVATRFADGRSVPQNLAEAAAWFERAANQGLAPAQFRLGGLYEKGMGVPKNLETARRFYVAAAEAGHAKAMHNLAVLYAEGIEGKPNYATAARWFRRASDHGVIDSQYNLGVLYARGIGVETNPAEAFKWFALASREGDRDAAKKRDDIGSRLDRQSLAAAMTAAQAWQAQPQPEAATQVRVPSGGWDAAPSPSTAKRTVGPAAEKQSRRPAQ